MTYEQIGAGILAACVMAWPRLVQAAKWLAGHMPKHLPITAEKTVGYEESIHNLALVRSRLNATEMLGEEKSPQRAAIDTLTLALVAGSDK
jgi:hypothetical protein